MPSPSHRTAIIFGCLKRFSPLMVLFFLGILTIMYGSAIQEQERTVTKLETPKDPVKVALVKTKKGNVEINKKFLGDDDWFKGLAVRVKNSSRKAITYLSVELAFPRDDSYIPADSRDPMQTLPYVDTIGYGGMRIYMPDSPLVGLKPIAPGEHVDIELPDRQYIEIKTALAQIGFPASIKKIEVRPEQVYFEDGTFWSSGTWYQRDPKNPKKLYLIDPDNPQKLIPIEPPPAPSGAASPTVFFHSARFNYKDFLGARASLFRKASFTRPAQSSVCGAEVPPQYTYRACNMQGLDCRYADPGLLCQYGLSLNCPQTAEIRPALRGCVNFTSGDMYLWGCG